MSKSIHIILVIAALFFCSTMTLAARDISILVTDADLDLPLEGTTLHLSDGTIIIADSDGQINLTISDGKAAIVYFSYPGYQKRRLEIKPADTKLFIKMRIEGILESEGLVIESKRTGNDTTQSGVSTTIAGNELKQTASIGLVEDVMTAVKTLPGVGYAGGWNALPSIRGGEPSELTASLDGFYVDAPFHWGGAFSIFNPNMVESAKLSHGIFSTRYGQATSGLLEVRSKSPPVDRVSLDFGYTTSAIETSVSIPYAGAGGLIIGGKVTYWDPFLLLASQIQPSISETVYVAPYIRDSYLKSSWWITNDFEWFVNGFLGSDGVGFKGQSQNKTLTTSNRFEWMNLLGFLSMGFHYNPDQNTLLTLMLGAGVNRNLVTFRYNESGQKSYSQAFIARWDTLDNSPPDGEIFDATSFSVNGLSNTFDGDFHSYNMQGRFDIDATLFPWLSISTGLEEAVRTWVNNDVFTGYSERASWLAPNGTLQNEIGIGEYSLKNDGNFVFSSGAYFSSVWKTDDNRLTVDLGTRIDHLFLQGKDFTLQSYPVINPRLQLGMTVLKNAGELDSLQFSAGTGLFSRPPTEIQEFDKKYNIKDYEFQPNRTWTSLVGTELKFGGEYKISLEAYYKQTFNRFYYRAVADGFNTIIVPHFDGKAEIWGLDLMLQKLESRYIDGWITYSYNYARYQNPTIDAGTINPPGFQGSGPVSSNWYWPSFHRFHTANLILNLKPTDGFTIMTRMAFATGRPQNDITGLESYPVKYGNTILEKWRKIQSYSDTNRTDISIPVDIKLSWFWYEMNSKSRSEFYIGAENIFVNLYTPKTSKSLDPYYGDDLPNSDQADFNIGFPMFSIGFKWSY